MLKPNAWKMYALKSLYIKASAKCRKKSFWCLVIQNHDHGLCFSSNYVTLVSLASSERSRSGAPSSGPRRTWRLRSSEVMVTTALWTCGPWGWSYTLVWVGRFLSTRMRTLISRSLMRRSCIHGSRGPSSRWRVRNSWMMQKLKGIKAY